MAESNDDIDGRNSDAKPRPEEVLNFVQFVAEEVSSSAGAKRDKKSRGADRLSVKGAAPEEAASSRRSKVPDSVQERFIQIGNNFYFPGGAEAFTREPNRLTTRSENAIVIQSMVAIARAESETGVITVGGSDFFRKEAWFAASLAGLQVKGYAPTEFERERLVRALATRQGHSAKAADTEPEARKERTANELISGRLVDHGPAPYQHDPKAPMSYFVRIETPQGDRDLWGVDLERAFRQSLSNPGIGDAVGIRGLGREPVTVLAEGRAVDAHRNQWSVERQEFLDQRREMAAVFRDTAIDAPEGTRRHAGLEGSYRTLEMGQAHADEQYRSTSHRSQFVEHLREYLAKTIEYGQALEPVGPPARKERPAEPQGPDLDYDRAR